MENATVVSRIAITPALPAVPKPEKVLPAGLVSIASMPGVSLDLRYRTANNFMHQDLYGEYAGHYLHEDAAVKLKKAAELLDEAKPGWKLRVYDALRPREIQKKMWMAVKGTSSVKYVADPREGSGHNYGMSVDVTLEDETGSEVDMGTEFDDFTPLAQPRNESMFLRNGKLTKEQYDNRLLLRRVMKQAGFGPLLQEWWHFNARGIKTIKSRYHIIDSTF
jgi:zinc D-Ala-D-Ala dipeptidase